MLKIALLFLFCAISGYGINGLPNNTDVATQTESNKPISTVVGVTNLNNANSNDKAATTQLPTSNPPVVITGKTPADLHVNPTVSNASSNNPATEKTQIVENTSAGIPTTKSLPTAADNALKPTVDNFNGNANTKATTTTTTTTTSTTQHPPPTTVLPIPTTEAPVVPVPAPKAGKWIVNETNQTCIVVNMAVQFNVSYILDNENKTVSKVFNLPDSNNNTVVTGECGKVEQYISLSFNDTKNVTNTFTVHFVKNETMKQYSLHHLEVTLLIPNNTVVLVHNTSLVSTGLSNSYRCLKQQNFTLTQNGTDKIMGYFLMSDLQFQAFKTDNNKDFGQAKDCKLDTPDIVPIAVGCALAGLVVIVLIAYLMGRRRSQGRGYLSM